MSAEDSLNDKSKRRRGLRQQADAAVQSVDIEDEVMDDEDDEEEGSSRGLSERKGRATPGRRSQETEEEKEEGNVLTRFVRRLSGYIEGVRSEVQKVVWPTREEVRRLTTIVIIVTIISAIVLGIISALFNAVIAAGLNTPVLIVGLVVVAIVIFAVYLRTSNRRTSAF